METDKKRVFFRCTKARNGDFIDVDADTFAAAEVKANEYAAFHDLAEFEIASIVSHGASRESS